MSDTQRNEPAAIATSSLPIPTGSGEASGTGDPSSAVMGLSMTPDHWYSFRGLGNVTLEHVPSVTKILGVMDKPALIPWAKRTVAEFAVRERARLEQMVQDVGEEQTARYLASLPDYQRDNAASVGSSVHLLADMTARGDRSDSAAFEIPEGTRRYLEAFNAFLSRYSASNIVSSEKAVINVAEQYAGTYDLLMTIDGELWLLDIKTSKGYYPEYGLQLAAYANAEFIVLPDDPRTYPMPKVKRMGVLHLRPEQYREPEYHGWALIEYPVTDRDYYAFLAARELFAWKAEKRFGKELAPHKRKTSSSS